MPAGEALTPAQVRAVQRAVTQAEESSGLRFSVYVGELSGESPRSAAQGLHAATATDPSDVVLLAIDPSARRLEIVTGSHAHRFLDDRSCALASLSVTSKISLGDLAGAIVDGLRALAEHARHPRTLHTDNV